MYYLTKLSLAHRVQKSSMYHNMVLIFFQMVHTLASVLHENSEVHFAIGKGLFQ